MTSPPGVAGRVPDPAFWQGRRVLVTGSSGFKGSWLCLMLARAGAEVSGFSLQPPTDPSLFELAGIGARIDQHYGDLRDAEMLASVVRESQPEFVFHLAAQALVREGFADPVGTYASNVMGTVHLLEAVRAQSSVAVLLNVTTDKVYAGASGEPHREGDRLGGQGPYSASKVCSEVVTEAAEAWASKRSLAIATARSGNTLGGGDWAADRLVPDCVRAAAAATRTEIRNPSAVRPWLFVLDTLTGYLLLAEALYGDAERFAGAWNFAPDVGAEPRVEELASAVLAALDGLPPVIAADKDAPAETGVLRLAGERARRELGWRPQLNWQDCVAWTCSWYRTWLTGGDVAAETDAQLDRYLEEVAKSQ